MMVEYLGADLGEANEELDKTKGAHVIFEYLEKVYEDEIRRAQQTHGDDEQVSLHISHAL